MFWKLKVYPSLICLSVVCCTCLAWMSPEQRQSRLSLGHATRGWPPISSDKTSMKFKAFRSFHLKLWKCIFHLNNDFNCCYLVNSKEQTLSKFYLYTIVKHMPLLTVKHIKPVSYPWGCDWFQGFVDLELGCNDLVARLTYVAVFKYQLSASGFIQACMFFFPTLNSSVCSSVLCSLKECQIQSFE